MRMSGGIAAAVGWEIRQARARREGLTLDDILVAVDDAWRANGGRADGSLGPGSSAPGWVAAFLSATCTGGDGERVSSVDLYRAYEGWAAGQGHGPVSKIAFGRALRAFGYQSVEGGANVLYWHKLGLRAAPPEAAAHAA